MKGALDQPEKIKKFMSRYIVFIFAVAVLASCRSTRKIQTAIGKKDTVVSPATLPELPLKEDTLQLIRNTMMKLDSNRIDYKTFSAKVKVEYKGRDGKNEDVNANIRMYKDSAIWINVNALLGIDVMRVLITKDSVKLLDKLNKTYTARSVDYLQEVSSLPLDLETVQDLLIGNALFVDSNIVSYSLKNDKVSMLSLGKWFKNLITLRAHDNILLQSKLDDVDVAKNRTAELLYEEYENKKGFPFSTKRSIIVVEKGKLQIKLDFKQYDFNEDVSFPFSVPKNYDRN
jgi:hypothetical protein